MKLFLLFLGYGLDVLRNLALLVSNCFCNKLSHSAGKESTRNAGDLVRSLGWEDPLEKGKATHSSILA